MRLVRALATCLAWAVYLLLLAAIGTASGYLLKASGISNAHPLELVLASVCALVFLALWVVVPDDD